jgi:hypothetical protein
LTELRGLRRGDLRRLLAAADAVFSMLASTQAYVDCARNANAEVTTPKIKTV